jgi:hypothetical protein
LIYDLTENKAYCLNESSAIIWQTCDGQKSFEEIARQTQIPQEFVWVAIEEFNKSNLLEDNMATQLPKDRQSRRKVLLKLSATATVLPLLTSIIAPRAIHAASAACNPLGTVVSPCTNPLVCVGFCMGPVGTQCCSGAAELDGTNTVCVCVESGFG